jgi:transcriptional regulator with XRE-family HTH domain
MTIQEKLRKIRLDKGLSLQNLADDIGISQAQYSNIESGTTELGWSRLLQIAGIYKMDVIEIITYGEEVEKMEYVKSKIEYHQKQAEAIAEDMIHWRRQATTLSEQMVKLQDEKEELKEVIAAMKKNPDKSESTSTDLTTGLNKKKPTKKLHTH